MTKRGYSKFQEPSARGSTGPDDGALGTVQQAGRTGPAAPSQLAGSDASTDRFSLTYFDPPKGLERYILTLFHFEWNEERIVDRHPGALGQLFVTLRGEGEVRFGDTVAPHGVGAFMFSGFDVAAPFEMHGPWHSLGASLSPLGWAALAQAPANANLNRFTPASDLLGGDIDGFSEELIEQYQAREISGETGCAQLADWIAPRLEAVPPRHEQLIDQAMTWLGSSLHPDVEMLFEKLPYSRRQAERLVSRYFGFTPAALARKMRAIRSANLLAQADLTDEAEAEIAAAFYDQPHMIREIRRYCGYTPSRLGGEGEPLFQTMLRMRNLDRLKHYRAIGAAKDSA